MPSKRLVRVAVLFLRIGPYHRARLEAFGETAEVTAIEACAMDDIYAWEKVEGAARFRRITLLDGSPNTREERRRLRQRMRQALDEVNPEVVAVPGWAAPEALCGLEWCLRNGVPAVCMSASFAQSGRRVWWKEAIKRRVVRLFSSALVGGHAQANYVAGLGMPKDRIFQGYNTIENEHFSSGAAEARGRREEFRRRLRLPGSYFVLPARFIEQKNLPRLLEAFARYRELAQATSREGQPQPWDLVLLGDGPLRARLASQVDELGLESSVLMPGFAQYDDLPAYYGLANAFILPSFVEPWGLVVNEAMACGLPVLVSKRCGCAHELVKEGVNGFTLDPDDVEQMAQAMLRLSSLPSPMLARMSQAGREIIAGWGPERTARGLKAAAEKAAAVGPSTARLTGTALLRALLWRGASAGEPWRLSPLKPLWRTFWRTMPGWVHLSSWLE
jgi:1,2-diacylglycerol 3-alpha-glucosyltransferase